MASSEHSERHWEMTQHFIAGATDDLHTHFNWQQSRYKSISTDWLMVYRFTLLSLMFVMVAGELFFEEVQWILVYETFWGLFGTAFMVLAVQKASYPDPYGQYQRFFKIACYSLEISFGFNSMATILFWVVLAPKFFPTVNWHDFMQAWVAIRMILLHTIPMLASVVELVLSDVTFIHSHWKYVFATGCSYIVANYIGYKFVLHSPLYPVVDWKNPAETILLFVVQAACMALMYLVGVWLSQKLKRRHE